MSASLVGSEMCIRDRTGTTRAGKRATTPTTPTTSPRRTGSTLTATGTPVSYTHLTLPTICSV
eukprot:2762559-Alexandrium_andersonii.AAC.1